jgi:hypothetical protein
MNWKLILQLSMFGLAMGIGTVFVIPSTVEPFLWLVIFLVCAYVIGSRGVAHPFLHGLAIGVVNSVWVTGSHVLLFSQYIANHAREMEMMKTMPMSDRPRLLMALMGPLIGIISGIVLGLFALAASKLMKSRTPPPITAS